MNREIQEAIKKTSCQPNKIFKRVKKIGQGQYGSVYEACLNDECSKKVAYKTSNSNLSGERNLAKYFRKLSTSGIKIYGYGKCLKNIKPELPKGKYSTTRSVPTSSKGAKSSSKAKTGVKKGATQVPTKVIDHLYLELLEGQSLDKYLPKRRFDIGYGSRLKQIVIQVLTILRAVHSKSKSFRHNDLHLGNIYITKKGEIKIIDYGLSTVNGIRNPEINKAPNETFRSMYGIYRGNHYMYDAHFFLNALYSASALTTPGFKRFAEDVLGPQYLGMGGGPGSMIHLHRLKEVPVSSRVHNVNLSYEKLFTHPYISGRSNTNKIMNSVKKNVKPTSIFSPKPASTQTMSTSNAAQILARAQQQKSGSKKPPTARRPAARSQRK